MVKKVSVIVCLLGFVIPYAIRYPIFYTPVLLLLCIGAFSQASGSIPKVLVKTIVWSVVFVTSVTVIKQNFFSGYATPILSLVVLSYLSTFQESKITKYENTFILFCLIGLIIQLCLFSEGRRLETSIGDPNFTGYIVFVMFLVLFYRHKILGVCLGAVFVPLLLSRTYFATLAIFLIVYALRHKIYNIMSYLHIDNFLSIFISVNVVTLLVSLFLVTQVDFKSVAEQETSGSRLTEVTGTSLYIRLYQNVRVFDMIRGGGYDAWIGLRNRFDQEYIVEKSRLKGKPPHNSLFYSVAIYGVPFTILYILTLNKIVNKWLSVETFPILVAYSAYAANLHALLLNWWIFALAISMLVANESLSSRRHNRSSVS